MKKDYLERLQDPRMEYYNHVYRDSKRWQGEPLDGKRVVVYCEQGFGDIIQMARYFKYLKPAHVTLHCPMPLIALLEGAEGVDAVVPKEFEELPDHDYHTLSLSLPFLFPDPGNKPYLSEKTLDLAEVPGFKVGIAWEGSPSHAQNLERSCPLKHFRKLQREGVSLFMLQPTQHVLSLVEGCDDMDLFGFPIEDFRTTAWLINAMDVVVSVDTAVLHLAGALGKRAYGLLCANHDKRWLVNKWYDSVELWRQPTPGDWEGLFDSLHDVLQGAAG
jgi:hypothetical protein